MYVPRWLHDWLERHQHPASRILHAIGIPLLVLAGCLVVWQVWAGRWDLWWRPVVLLVGSYVLQGAGHLIEGSEMGEVAVIRRFWRRQRRDVEPS